MAGMPISGSGEFYWDLTVDSSAPGAGLLLLDDSEYIVLLSTELLH